jgi:hypothetical protein
MTNTELRDKLMELINSVLDYLPWGEIMYDTDEVIATRLIANGVTLNQWIPVTERLPEEDKKILVLCKNGAMFVGVMGKFYGGTEIRFMTCTALNSTKLLNKGRVTHWMPLPEPPKEE